MTTFLLRRLEAIPERITLTLPPGDENLVVYAFRNMPNKERHLLDDGNIEISYDGVRYESKWEKVEGVREDFPHHSPIRLNAGTDKEVVVLLARPEQTPTPRDNPPLVPAFCAHGLSAHPDGRPLRIGRSWVLSRYMYTSLTTPPKVGCALCFGEVKPDDWMGD